MKKIIKTLQIIAIVLIVIMATFLCLACIGMALKIILDMLGIVKFSEPFF